MLLRLTMIFGLTTLALSASAMDIDIQAGQPAITSGTSLSIKNTRISNYSFPVTAQFSWDGTTNSLKLVDLVQEPDPNSIAGKWTIANDSSCSGYFAAGNDFTVNDDGTCSTYIPCKWTLKDGHIEITWPSVPEWLYAGEVSQGGMSGKITDNSAPWGCWQATRVRSLLTTSLPAKGGAAVPPRH